MSLFESSDTHAYTEFFIRHHKPGTRPITAPIDSSVAVVVADCRVIVFNTVAEKHQLWIKGWSLLIAQLIQDNIAARTWTNGAVASFRLSPQDYHRYHSSVPGRVKWWKQMNGDYYAVDLIAVRSDIDMLTVNSQCALRPETKEFSDVLFVAIEASDVGIVKLSEKITSRSPKDTGLGALVEKGEEVGISEFGGSSIIDAFEQGRTDSMPT